MKNRIFAQEMASSSSHNSIALATLLEWYKIRDTIFGDNRVFHNIPLALELALSCQHPDARWLSEACVGMDLTTKEDSKRVFSALGQSKARALCFAWLSGVTTVSTAARRASTPTQKTSVPHRIETDKTICSKKELLIPPCCYWWRIWETL
jgi:hypothetical protein